MTAAGPLNIVIIVGSTRRGRFGPTVAGWFAGEAGRHPDLALDVVDLAETDLPGVLTTEAGAPDAPAPVRELGGRLARADAFVVVTPEYNRSFPAPLKAAIDWFVDEWRAKPVGFVSYGGASGGLRAVEHLRQVFAELHAVTVHDTVSFHSCRDKFDDHGRPIDAAGCGAAAESLIDQLSWWARTLRDARAARAYAA
ncbi:NADPH-dependent oxidoreductase [Actinomadura spongiicola]|uniref:NADPH-dependent oxidoreductase n=1 Tax=Actinomadura spongiicola TaxID=2303421 RepID=A0A372GQ09_9ACTN|nr:NAD(P)H-dependent oxidoreductase [Actinomadura spongiicola]RFS87488.1 NADPH-dependent oxidoreductase [Actinomadura spongiicola]